MNAPLPDCFQLRTQLNCFSQTYHRLAVLPEPLDLTDAFWSDDARRHVAPRSYGDLPQNRVLGYVALGKALIAKYCKDSKGRVLRENGIPVIAKFSMEQQVMACLCLFDLRNTSLYEIADALEGTHRLQGYRRWHLRKLNDAIRQHYPKFSAFNDTCFLFAGAEVPMLRDRIALNSLWLKSLVRDGEGILDCMSAHEAFLMSRVFPSRVLAGDAQAIHQRSYMFGRPIWEPMSSMFLARKVALRQDFLARC